jgi:hypothetical protein
VTDLIRHREREPSEYRDAPIPSMLPLRSRLRTSADHREDSIDLVFELLTEADLARLVIVDFVVDLGDREPVKAYQPELGSAEGGCEWRVSRRSAGVPVPRRRSAR